MPMIQCLFCEATTTKGIGERSGFAQIKGHFGRRGTPNYLAYNIIFCSEHSNEGWTYFKKLIKGQVFPGQWHQKGEGEMPIQGNYCTEAKMEFTDDTPEISCKCGHAVSGICFHDGLPDCPDYNPGLLFSLEEVKAKYGL